MTAADAPLDSHPDAIPSGLAVLDDCWNRIGVYGDQSCSLLGEAVHCRNCSVYIAAGQRLFDTAPPGEMVEEWTRRIAEPPLPAETELESLLLFRLHREWLAVDVRAVVEVAEPRELRRIPQRSGKLLQGLVNIRGELQLCLALEALLEIPEAPDEASASPPRFLVTTSNGKRWVFPVNEVSGVIQVAQSAIGEPPATVRRDAKRYTRGVLSWQGRSVGVLNAARVFDSLAKGLS